MQTRCPQCSSLVEIHEENEISKLTCLRCGQSFDLLAETTATSLRERHRTFGQFELVQLVGAGAFGEVWKAKDRELDRFVAIKIPHAQKIVGQKAELFLREARAAAQLDHANIVPVFEVGRHEQVLFIVSQFVDGVSLEDFLSAKKLSVGEAAAMLATIAEAIGYAHSAGIIHRDLKPSNVLLDGSGKPYIVDFGLAKRETGELTVTIDGTILGTPLYMSPEQARGESHAVDARTDVYSLGVILFRLLTHELPFRGNRPMLLHQIVHAEPPTLRSLNSSIPRDIETIALKCLQKDREKRYSSCAELAHDLRCFLNGDPIQARPTGPVEKAVRWCRRRPLVSSLAAGLTLSLITGFISVFVLWQRASFSAKRALAISDQANQVAERAVRQEKLTNQYLYVAHMNMVQEAWDRGQVGRATELLKRQKPEFRTFPWYYYNRIVGASRPTQTFEHEGIVTQVAFLPTRPILAIAGNEGQVAVWDFEHHSRLVQFRADERQVTALTNFSVDGKHLIWTGRDGKLVFYETKNYTRVGQDRTTSSPWEVALSNDGVHFATANEKQTLVLGKIGKDSDRVFEQFSDMRTVAFTKDGAMLAISYGKHDFGLVRVEDGVTVCTSQSPVIVDTIAVAENGRWLATGNRAGDVVLWKLENLEPIQSVNFHSGGVRYLSFSDDSQILVSSGFSDAQIAFWSPSETGLLKKRSVHSGSIQQLSPIRNTKRFAATVVEDNLIHVWDANGSREEEVETHVGNENLVYGLTVSSSGRYIAAGGRDRKVQLFDRKSGAADLSIAAHDGWLWSTCFADSGQMLLTTGADRSIRMWDSSTGKQLGLMIDPDLASQGQFSHSESIQFLLLLPDGDTLASASRDSTIKLWSISRMKLLARLEGGHQGSVNALASPRTGRLLYSIGDDGKVIEWDLETCKQKRLVMKIEGAGWAIACSPDGMQIAAGGVNKAIHLWDNAQGREFDPILGHQAELTSLNYSADGSFLASTSFDRTVQLHGSMQMGFLPSSTPRKSITLHGHSGDVTSSAFSPDGRTLASCGSDRTIRFWDLATGESVGLLQGHTDHIHCIKFDSTGTRLASASWDKTARVWWAPRIEK